jgi:hypothetical protein
MSGRARLVGIAIGAWLLPALALACGAPNSSRAASPAPYVAPESLDFGPGDGEPGDGQRLIDSTVTPEPAPPEPPPAPAPSPGPPRLTPAEIANIKALLIQASVDAYDGSCPCPYYEARDGRSCGRRSAYSRAGGEEPLCYPEDVSDEMVYEYWASQQ